MHVELISTGAELLRGVSVDSNAAWIASRLTVSGFAVVRQVRVGDDEAEIASAVRSACRRAHVVILTGGLGPTRDDRTREGVALAFDRPLRFDPDSWRLIRRRFRRFRKKTPARNRNQAMFPAGAEVLANAEGTAPGFMVDGLGSRFFAMPGVPFEMKAMFTREVLPRLPGAATGESLELRAFGLSESEADDRVAAIVKEIPDIRWGLTVLDGILTFSFRATGRGARTRLRTLERAVRSDLGDAWLGRSPATPADVLAGLLRRRRARAATAESCTGGRVAALLTAVPGISEWYRGGVIAYANEEKISRLEVPEGLIRKHGAVSRQVAEAMAAGIARTSETALGLATTGIAGPGGGTPRKPVGLVWMAASFRGTVRAEKRIFPGDRERIQVRAAFAAVDLGRRVLQHG